MYSRQNSPGRRAYSIPQNYSGNAFDELTVEEIGEESESGSAIEAKDAADAVASAADSKGFLPININSEELIIIGIVLLLFQSDKGDGIIPLLLAILFLG